MAKDNITTSRRQARVRRSLRAHAYGKPRLTVFRSSKQIYCQIIDDDLGRTLAAASSLEKANRENLKTGATVESAKVIGQQIAERAVQAGIKRSRVRPRCLYVSWTCQGAGGRRPRRRAQILE